MYKIDEKNNKWCATTCITQLLFCACTTSDTADSDYVRFFNNDDVEESHTHSQACARRMQCQCGEIANSEKLILKCKHLITL